MRQSVSHIVRVLGQVNLIMSSELSWAECAWTGTQEIENGRPRVYYITNLLLLIARNRKFVPLLGWHIPKDIPCNHVIHVAADVVANTDRRVLAEDREVRTTQRLQEDIVDVGFVIVGQKAPAKLC